MEEQILSQPSYLSVIWLILALNIWIANIFTAFILWRSKISREKSEIGRTLHSLWNLICTDVAFSLVGLNLFVNMTMILARDRPLSSGWCDFFGFLHTFSFNFAAFGILVGIIDRSYNLLKPFKYNIYLKGESRVPAIIFVCSALYGAFLAIVPLTRLGNYYQSEYATCLISYGEKVATRLTVVFNFSLFLAILTFITLYFRQMLKVYAKRRQMNVSVTRRKETLIFGLVISSLFLTCWCPYMIAMLVSNISSDKHPGETGMAVLFGITLIPLLASPVITYILHGHYRDEFKNIFGCIQTYLMSRLRKTTG